MPYELRQFTQIKFSVGDYLPACFFLDTKPKLTSFVEIENLQMGASESVANSPSGSRHSQTPAFGSSDVFCEYSVCRK